MTEKEYNSTGFYGGIRAVVTTNGAEEIVKVRYADFEEKSIESISGKTFTFDKIVKFIPPDDYYPCKKCGAIHHPKQNTLCER